MQARDINSPNQIVGHFLPPIGSLTKLKNCAGNVNNSAMHSATEIKTFVSLKWQVPSDFSGTVVFK